MGGKARSLWAVAAIVVIIAGAGALAWVVWRSPHRSDLSTFGAFAAAIVALAIPLIVYVAKFRRPGASGRGRTLDELADSLAGAVEEQWTRAATERLLLQPEPIPVRWERSSSPLAGPVSAAVESHQFHPLPGLPPARWRELTDRLRRAPGSPIAKALSSPLTLTLVRDTYREGDDVGKLLDFCDRPGHFVSQEEIEDYLLDRVLPAAYEPRPGEPLPRYRLQEAQRALAYVAARMNQDGTRDLAWWQIPAWASGAPRVVATGLLVAPWLPLGSGEAGALLGGLWGFVAGVFVGCFALGLYGGLGRGSPKRIAPLWWRRLFSRVSLAAGIGFALLAGLGFGLAYGLLFGVVGALVFGSAAGLVSGLLTGLAKPAAGNASALSPRASWRRDRTFGLVAGLVAGFGLGFGLGLAFGLTQDSVPGVVRGPGGTIVHVPGPGVSVILGQLAIGILMGLGLAIWFGLVLGPLCGFLVFTKNWAASLAFAQLAIRRRTPLRLMRFLEDALERDVLRTVGPVYQFRHARLQDRLAAQAARVNVALGAPTVQEPAAATGTATVIDQPPA